MGPIASLVRREVLLVICDERWHWQLRGYGPLQDEAVECDELVALTWASIDHALSLIGHEDASRRWCARRRHQRALQADGAAGAPADRSGVSRRSSV